MIRLLIFVLPLFIICTSPSKISAQSQPEIHISGSSGLDKEISLMIDDLDLKFDQKLVIGVLLLKYAVEFDFSKFDEASKSKQYMMAKSKLKQFEKDLKGVLDKNQYKVYKKHRKKIKKELMHSV